MQLHHPALLFFHDEANRNKTLNLKRNLLFHLTKSSDFCTFKYRFTPNLWANALKSSIKFDFLVKNLTYSKTNSSYIMMIRYFFLTALFLAFSLTTTAQTPLQPIEPFMEPLPIHPHLESASPRGTEKVSVVEVPPTEASPVTKSEIRQVAPTKKTENPVYGKPYWQEGYNWLADVASQLNRTEVPYADFERYQKAGEDEVMIAADLFFDHDTYGETVIEDNDAAIPTFLPFPDDHILNERMRAIENRVSLTANDEVKRFIYYYGVKAHGFTRELRNRSNIYFPLFEKKLREHGMPEEIKHLAVIESALRPKIRSHAGAVGLSNH